MAHGSKKWIVAYDGQIKKSRHRTKDDWYRDLKWWAPMQDTAHHRYGRGKDSTFCPQCKHVMKAIPDESATDVAWAKLKADYDALYGPLDKARIVTLMEDPLSPRWHDAMRVLRKGPKYIAYWEYVEKVGKPPAKWVYHWNTFLCSKCKRKLQIQDRKWHEPYHGRKANYQDMRRAEYNYYRQHTKSVMRRGKYDEDVYETLLPHKKGWLD